MTEIPLEIMMHAERFYDEGGDKTIPAIIAEAIIAERDDRLLRAGRHLHEVAASMGWPDDGEGAFEFITRRAYERGLENAAPASAEPVAWISPNELRHLRQGSMAAIGPQSHERSIPLYTDSEETT